MEQILTAELSDIFSLSAVECSEFLFVAKHGGGRHEWKAKASMLSQNVQWIELFCDLEFDPRVLSNRNIL